MDTFMMFIAKHHFYLRVYIGGCTISIMPTNITTGKIGEDLACGYLVKDGYKVLKRNYKAKWDEIDIIAKEKDGTLVFVEVKTLKDGGRLMPEDNMTSAKIKKLKRACAAVAGRNADLIDDRKGWRMDLLALTISGDKCIIKHYKNVV